MEATCAVMALVPELVKALDERQYPAGMGISYYLCEKHPELVFTHSDLVQLAHALAERYSGEYVVKDDFMCYNAYSGTRILESDGVDRWVHTY